MTRNLYWGIKVVFLNFYFYYKSKKLWRHVWAHWKLLSKNINLRNIKGKIINNKSPLYTAHIYKISREW